MTRFTQHDCGEEPSSEFADAATRSDSSRLRVGMWLDRITFTLLVLAAVATALTTKALALAIPALVVWLATLVVTGRRPGSSPLIWPMLALLLAAALSSCFAYDPSASWARVRIFAALILVVLVGDIASSTTRLKVLVTALLVSALLAVGWAMWQQLFGMGVTFRQPPTWMTDAGITSSDILVRVNGTRVSTPEIWARVASALRRDENVRMEFVRASNDDAMIVIAPGHEILATRLVNKDAVDRGHSARATGFYKHYLPFSYLLTVVALLAWGLVVALRGRGRSLIAAVCVVLVSCLAATVTRSAIAFVILGAAVVVWQVAGWKPRAAFAATAIALLVLSSLWIRHERGLGWVSAADAGTQYRLAIWRDGFRLIGQHPLVGVGFDSVFRHPDHWNIEAYRRFPLIAHFHSTLIEYAVDGGLLTLAAWLWLLAAYVRMLLRTMRNGLSDPWLRGTTLGVFGGVVALIGISLVQYIGADPAIMALFWLTIGLGMAIQRCSVAA